MQKSNESSKHKQIEKSNTSMFIILGSAAAVLSFSIISVVSLTSRLKYQAKVINARTDTEKQLKKDTESLTKLITAYENFDSTAESVIGTSDKNSKIVLDSLPSKYDFPALTASIEKIFSLTPGVSLLSTTGSDQEATAQQSDINPQPIEIPIKVEGKGSYDAIQKLVTNFQLSIRPFKVVKFVLNAQGNDQNNMTFRLDLITYYMPAKNLEILKTEVR